MRRLQHLLCAFLALVALGACGGEEPSRANGQGSAVAQAFPPVGGVLKTSPQLGPQGLEVLYRSVEFRREQSYRPVDFAVETANESMIPGATAFPYDDPRIRFLGGRYSQPLRYPGYMFWWPQALSTVVDPAYETGGYSPDRSSVWDGFQFVLPAGQDQFEIFSIDNGYVDGVYLEIDGVRTTPAPISLGHGNQGALRYSLITLPHSQASRDIRIVSQRSMLGEIRLPPGSTLGKRDPSWDEGPKVVFVGDSITEGTGAGSVTDGWPIEFSQRLGIDNPVIVALGGTGYLNRVAGRPNFREHIEDVTEAFPGDRPDIVFVAGGINDCAFHEISDIGIEALAYFRELREAAPDMAIVVLGPFVGPSGYEPRMESCAAAIFAAADSVSNTYQIDVSKWVTPQTSTFIFNGDGSDPHPVRTGHLYYAKLAEQAMLRILEANLQGPDPDV